MVIEQVEDQMIVVGNKMKKQVESEFRRLETMLRDMDADIEKLQYERASTQRHLDDLRKSCDHVWDTQYTPIVHKAYTTPGDPPGTMGVDWRGPIFVPEERVPQWTRTCKNCKKVEKSQSYKKATKTELVPVF